MLFALAGALGALFARHLMSPWPFIAVLLAVTGIIIAGYIQENRSSRDSVGLTTEVAALTVTLLGGAVIFGYASLAVALAISTSAILAFKQPMHAFVAKLGRDDIYAALKLLIATFIVLPFLPDAPVDPWQALNPYKLWLLVIFISGLSGGIRRRALAGRYAWNPADGSGGRTRFIDRCNAGLCPPQH